MKNLIKALTAESEKNQKDKIANLKKEKSIDNLKGQWIWNNYLTKTALKKEWTLKELKEPGNIADIYYRASW